MGNTNTNKKLNTNKFIRDNINREFSDFVRKQERTVANNKCRICGTEDEWLQCAHIYSYSLTYTWRRSGSIYTNWKSDKYVRSYKNCLLLCKTHHQMIDNNLNIYTVEYLESLKINNNTCTALIQDKKTLNFRRCQNHVNKEKNYLCHKHINY